MSDKQVAPEAVSDDMVSTMPVGNEAIQELLGQVVAGMSKMSASIEGLSSDVTSIRSDVSAMKADITSMKADITSMNRDIKTLQRNVDDLSDRADRQDKRLAAIETLPAFPMSQPARYYATEAHSVSMAQRIRLSHLG